MNDDTDGVKKEKSGDKKHISTWQCPLCPMIYKRRFHFDKHIHSSHNLQPEEVSDAWNIFMFKDEFEQKLLEADRAEKEARRRDSDSSPPKSDWGREAFSTRFSCHFCGEIFKRDCNYVTHLRLQHKEEDGEVIQELVNDVEHFKLDGCEYTCIICQGKYAQHSSFMRHVRNHGLTYKEYQELHGNPETVTGTFDCRLCQRSLKRSRNAITQHMKMVHFLSWQQYKDKVGYGVKQETVEQDPLDDSSLKIMDCVEMFECALCDSRVKGKKQHLTRVHKIEQDVYELYVTKRQLGEQIPTLETCKICDRLCFELPKHVRQAHKMEPEEYEATSMALTTKTQEYKCSIEGCSLSFRREGDLLVHIDINHANDDDLRKMDAKNEILRNSEASKISEKLLCKMCGATYCSRASLWGHVNRHHKTSWREYEETYGHVEKDISSLEPFVCKICDTSVKNERNVILRHITRTHGIKWKKYVENYVKNNNFLQQSDESDLVGNHKEKAEQLPKGIKRGQDKSSNVKRREKSNINIFDQAQNQEDQEDMIKIEETDFTSRTSQDIDEILTVKSNNRPPSSLSVKGNRKAMNVADKNLKTCVKCDIDFPSRLRFIRHCQMAHKMKFKLKNGDKLTLP